MEFRGLRFRDVQGLGFGLVKGPRSRYRYTLNPLTKAVGFGVYKLFRMYLKPPSKNLHRRAPCYGTYTLNPKPAYTYSFFNRLVTASYHSFKGSHQVSRFEFGMWD